MVNAGKEEDSGGSAFAVLWRDKEEFGHWVIKKAIIINTPKE